MLSPLDDKVGRAPATAPPRGLAPLDRHSQPRNFLDATRHDALQQARDAIQQHFGSHALDFWTAIASPNGALRSEYDSGDGVHLNDHGHALLAKLVISCAIPERVLSLNLAH